MSRQATDRARGAKGAGGLSALTSEDNCPVCKTNRYLNKDLEFLINPECYHSMCVNCVNRLFNDAPNQCPYFDCRKTLRRAHFRPAFFGDLTVEREVDIRRRVAAVFNKREDDFESLRAYNDFLQMVEDLTFQLVNGSKTERDEADRTLVAWEKAHEYEIASNRRRGREDEEQTRRRLAADREKVLQRRLAAKQEDVEERVAKIRMKAADIDTLARAPGDGEVRLRRRVKGAARAATGTMPSKTVAAAAADVGQLSIQGLKEKRRAPAAEGRYDPFGGLASVPSRYKLHGNLKHPMLDPYRQDQKFDVGGYSFEDYTALALFDAFAGLGVFVQDEKAEDVASASGNPSVVMMEVDP